MLSLYYGMETVIIADVVIESYSPVNPVDLMIASEQLRAH